MKIISNKKFEEMNQTLIDLQLELNDLQGNYDTKVEQVEYLQKELEKEKTISQAMSKVVDNDIVIIAEHTMIIRKLKTLLTKNKIDYKSVLEKSDKNDTKKTNKTRKTTRKTK